MGILKRLLLALFEQKLPQETEADRARVALLRQALVAASGKSGTADAAVTWQAFSRELVKCIDRGDPRSFLQWPVVRKSMFVSNARYVAEELRWLRRLPDWKNRWRPALRESPIGRPRPYPRYPRSSGNLIHHGYSLARFEYFSGIHVDTLDLVYEFGGGYGSMARLFYQLGFRGHYLIQDLPGFSALQRFYIDSLGYYKKKGHLSCIDDPDSVGAALTEQASGAGRKMFLATWSLSETPISVRDQVLQRVRRFDYLLVAFQHRFEDIDNLEYFSRWADELGQGEVVELREIDHLPGNSYLFISRSAEA